MAYPPAALPDVLPGEDRAYGTGLFVDLIPKTSWFRNVRAAVAPADWDQLRRIVYHRAAYRCEACAISGVRLEAHERFTYDAPAGVQRLMRLLCLCEWCHTATHMGMAGVRGVQDLAFGHLMAVTGMTEEQAEEHVDEAFARWTQRSRIAWHVDLSMITAAGLRLREPPPPPAPREAKDAEAPDILVVTTTVTAIRLPRAPREPGPGEQALAALYKKHADELGAIEAAYKTRPPWAGE
jgi:hypothetical protein